MNEESTAHLYGALSPEELLTRYDSGERDFRKVNLLRAEIEHIASIRRSSLEPPESDERLNVLWSDFKNPFEREFEWDAYGRFIPIEYDDLLPPRDLRDADLHEIRLDGSYLYPVNLEGANLHRAALRRAILLDVNLRDADLSYADLRDATINGDLSGANLYMARLDRCLLQGAAVGADLGRTKLRRANLAGLDLRGASLTNAHFDQTVLSGADLRGVVLTDVRLSTAYVDGVKLEQAQVEGFLESLCVVLDSNI